MPPLKNLPMSVNTPAVTRETPAKNENKGKGLVWLGSTTAAAVAVLLASSSLFPEPTIPPIPPITSPPNAQALGRSRIKDTTRPPIPPIPDCPPLPAQKACRAEGIAICTTRKVTPPGCTPADINDSQRKLVDKACSELIKDCKPATNYCGKLMAARLGEPVCPDISERTELNGN